MDRRRNVAREHRGRPVGDPQQDRHHLARAHHQRESDLLAQPTHRSMQELRQWSRWVQRLLSRLHLVLLEAEH